jgi:hemerythrin
MAKFKWHDRYRLGMPLVDAQHEWFFGLANRVTQLLESGRADDKLFREAFAALLSYSQKHFREEEALMRKMRYPAADRKRHASVHNAFVDRVSAMAQRLKAGNPNVGRELSAFVTGWLTCHILQMDVKYIRFYQSRQ